MDWSFASKPGAAPSLMSFRSAAREEPTFPQFSAFDGAKNPASRILTHQVGSGCSSWFSIHVSLPVLLLLMRDLYLGIIEYLPCLILQRSFGESPQYAAVHRAQQPQHALNGARVIPVSSPFNQNNPMFRVQSSPSLPNGVASSGPFKQPPFTMNNAVTNSTVGVYGTR